MRIIVTVSDQAWGGKHRYMLDTAAGLTDLGHEVVVLAESGGRMSARCRAAGVAVLDTPSYAERPAEAASAVRAAVSAAGVVITTGRHDMAVVQTAVPTGTRDQVIVVFRHSAFPLADSGLARALLDRADAVFPTSREQLERQFADDTRAEVLQSGVSREWRDRVTGADQAAARAGLDLDVGAFVFVVLARLSWEKGIDRVVRAFAVLGPGAEHAVLLVAGEGDQAAELVAVAAENGVADRVRFLGHFDDPADLVVASDVVVLASTVAETGPLALKEAMAAARPVVASSIGGIGEFVADGETGLLVTDDDELAAAMRKLVADPGLAESLGVRAREAVEEGHLFERRVRYLSDRLHRLGIRKLPLADVLGELSFDEVRLRAEAESGLVFVPHTSQITELDSRTYQAVAAAAADRDARLLDVLGEIDARFTAELLFEMGAMSHARVRVTEGVRDR